MLTEEQLACVNTTEPRVGVMAGAGTGKTSVIVARIRKLLDSGVSPRSIVVFTFTRKAAQELVDRLGEDANGMRVGTFHSISLDYDRSLECDSHLQVLGERASRVMLDTAVSMAGVKGTTAHWHKIISSRGMYPNIESHQKVIDYYGSLLRINGATDYQGLLIRLLVLAAIDTGSEIRYVLVDEAQDTDPLQWKIVDAFVSHGAELFCVGDIKQSIYGWRGANYKDFLDRCPVIYNITESFRNPPDILDAANAIILESGMESPLLRSSKTQCGLSLTADPVSITVKGLIKDELFSPSDIAVLCRTNRTVQLVQEELQSDGIKCTDLAGDRAKLEILQPLISLIAYPNGINRKILQQEWSPPHDAGLPNFLERLPDITDAEMAVLANMWRDGLCVKPTVRAVLGEMNHVLNEESVELWNNKYGDWDLRDALQDLATSAVTPSNSSGVTVCTVHQSKGLEFPATVVVCEPISRIDEEDYRVFYVALTRARERCIVTDSCRVATPFMQTVRREHLKWRLR